MEIHARIPLTLPNEFYRTTLSYDTFEKATFDSYLIGSLVKYEKNKKKAFAYIDEITGNGSLNKHFKKIYEKISEFSDSQVDEMLKNSLFPITRFEKGHFKYYPMLNASRLNDHVYPGNLKDDEQKLIDSLMPKDEDAKFLKMEYEQGIANSKEDFYEASFSEDGIRINLGDGRYFPISQDDFNKLFENDLAGEKLNVAIEKEITDGNWSILKRDYFKGVNEAEYQYCDSDKKLTVLTSEFIKVTDILELFGYFFYKETRYDFVPKNEKQIIDALEYLEKSKALNNFKTKSLVQMFNSINDIDAQKYINYILARKESKEIADIGLKLLKNGLELGWDNKSILQFKKFADSSMLTRIYELNPKLDYLIDEASLSKEHLKEKQEYIENRKNMMNEIQLMLGKMDTSGVREKSKSLPKDSVVNSVKNFYNNWKAHNRIDYDSLSLPELYKKYKEIKNMYQGDYMKVVERIKKLESK